MLRAHENVFHSGLESNLANVRLNYWINKRRPFVKKELKQCYVCKLIQGKFLLPPETPLPSFRVNCCYPFETAGLDYAGPLLKVTIMNCENGTSFYLLVQQFVQFI